MVKTCYVRSGQPFQVDDEDYELVSAFGWQRVGQQNGKGGAIMSAITVGRLIMLKELIELHRTEPQAEVDHINGNPFDNRRENLRIVSRSQNAHYKWKRLAFERLHQGVKCGRKCEKQATQLFHRLPPSRYLYLCDDHSKSYKPDVGAASQRVLSLSDQNMGAYSIMDKPLPSS